MVKRTFGYPHPLNFDIKVNFDYERNGERVKLPFVMGVLADLSGRPIGEPPKLGDRIFAEISKYYFDDHV